MLQTGKLCVRTLGTLKVHVVFSEMLTQEGWLWLFSTYHMWYTHTHTHAYTCTHTHSSLWWMFYSSFYRRSVEHGATKLLPIPLVQACCGVSSAVLAATLTNPMDAIRTRYQVTYSITYTAVRFFWCDPSQVAIACSLVFCCDPNQVAIACSPGFLVWSQPSSHSLLPWFSAVIPTK